MMGEAPTVSLHTQRELTFPMYLSMSQSLVSVAVTAILALCTRTDAASQATASESYRFDGSEWSASIEQLSSAIHARRFTVRDLDARGNAYFASPGGDTIRMVIARGNCL